MLFPGGAFLLFRLRCDRQCIRETGEDGVCGDTIARHGFATRSRSSLSLTVISMSRHSQPDHVCRSIEKPEFAFFHRRDLGLIDPQDRGRAWLLREPPSRCVLVEVLSASTLAGRFRLPSTRQVVDHELASSPSSARHLSSFRPENVPKASQEEYEQTIESVPFESRLPSREAAGRRVPHGASIAHKRSSLSVPLRIDPIDRVFQHCGGAEVVPGVTKTKPLARFVQSTSSATSCSKAGGPAGLRHRLVEERHREVAEIEKLRFNSLSRL